MFTKFHVYIINIVFSIAVLTRIYKISKPEAQFKSENKLYNDFEAFCDGDVPFDTNPISGRFILFFPFYFLTKGNTSLIESHQKYLRALTGLASSFVPPLITSSLILYKVNTLISAAAGIFLSLEPTIVISSRTYTIDGLFLLLVSLVIFLSALEKRINHPLLIQGQCLCATVAVCTDFTGFLSFPYLILTTKNKKKILPDLLSLLMIFIVVEIMTKAVFSTKTKGEFDGAPLSMQFTETIKKMGLLFDHPPPLNEMFSYPLFRIKPQTIYKNENEMICATCNFPIVLAIDAAVILNPFDIYTVFYWLSLFMIWEFKKIELINYTLPFLFGVMSLARGLQKCNETVRCFVLAGLLLFGAAYFYVYSSWIYGTEMSPSHERLINIWQH